MFGWLAQSFCLQMDSEAKLIYSTAAAVKEIKAIFVASYRHAAGLLNPKCLWARSAGGRLSGTGPGAAALPVLGECGLAAAVRCARGWRSPRVCRVSPGVCGAFVPGTRTPLLHCTPLEEIWEEL